MRKRIFKMILAICVLFFGLNIRVATISLTETDKKASTTHGTYTVSVGTGRGTIYDANMVPITNKNVKYVAAVSPFKNNEKQKEIVLLHTNDKEYVEKCFKKGLPFTVAVDTSNLDADGVNVYTLPVRYEKEAVAPHITGYIDSENKGVSGIEKAFDDVLKNYSQNIKVTYNVDAKRRPLAGAQAICQSDGNYEGGVVLTLDRKIQLAAQKGADKYLKNGSVIVMDIKSGDIAAAVSEPEYNPLEVAKFINAQNSPLLNRVFTSYNLGSAFKIAVTCAALNSGISESFKNTCSGVINVSGRDFHCEHLAGHGEEDMSQAFANSCNPYFIRIGLDTGAKNLLTTAKLFGFGKPTTFGPGYSSEAGVLPTIGQLASPASVANFSMGQGQLMVTPVQVACMVSTVANGGKLPVARLVKGIYDGKKIIKDYPNAIPEQIVSKEIALKVSGFMVKTVEEGTGKPAKPTYGGAGGKTATAETGWVKNGVAINQAWFAGFYPAKNPKYAIVVMCENGSAGGRDAGPVFKYIADSMSESFGFPKALKDEK